MTKTIRSSYPIVRALVVTALALAPAMAAAATGRATPSGNATASQGDSPLAQASHSVQEDLDASLRELTALRETIRAEKVPMSQQLGSLETRLADLRRQYEDLSRAQDTKSLESGNVAGALKLRQDELAYVGNLMDEFARSFEADLHISEQPRYGETIGTAKSAHESTDLTPVAKLDRQTALVTASLGRVGTLLGGTRYAGKAVDPKGAVTEGRFAMVGPVVMFASLSGSPAGLAVPQAGSALPAIRPLEASLTSGLTSIVTTGKGTLPLDPSRGGALQQLISRGSLFGYFKKGGPIMYPLLFVSILALTVLIERILFLVSERRKRDHAAVRDILALVEAGDVEGAIQRGRPSRDFVARALTYAMGHREKSLSDALIRSSSQELHRYTRGIAILDTIVTMAPLLGLLGTVTGMMGSFGMLGGAELSAPAQITGGIAEALIATAFGLCIAVTSLIPMNILHSRAEKARHEMEDACTHLEILMKPVLEVESALLMERQRVRLAHAGMVTGAASHATAAAALMTGGTLESPALSHQES